MYNFIDVNEATEGTLLPAEALQINGEFIENIIDGYRTLHVSGREALSAELTTYETGIRDGAKVQNKRFPARIITVTYQLNAASNEAFRNAFNRLAAILNVEDAELIFNDETDKFFIGTPAGLGEIEPGSNHVVGSFELYCADPFKYSVVEYEAKADGNGNVFVDYGGTYKAFPTLEASFYNETDVADDGTAGTLTGNGDCGYVAFFNESEKIIQLGDPAEADTVGNYAKSQTLINQTFLSNTAWGTTAKNLWAVNNGVVLPSDVQQTGSVAMKAASYTTPSSPKDTSGTLLNKAKSDVGSPYCFYTVTAKATNRTANSVYLTVTVTSALQYSGSYFGYGYGLKGSLYVGGSWHDVTLKTTSDYWKGQSGHTVSFSFTVSGLSASQTSLTGMQFKVTRTDGYTDGSCTLNAKACSNLAISKFETAQPNEWYLAPAAYGTAQGKYHGPSITRTIGADQAGEVGASNFTFTYEQKMCIGNTTAATNQLGGFHCHLTTNDGKVVAGVRIVKNAAGKNATLVLYVNGVVVHQVTIDLSYYNKYFGAGTAVKTSKIIKSGNKITFNIGGYAQTFLDDAVTELKVGKVTFLFEQCSAQPVLEHNGIYTAKFIKNNCASYKDVPNKFSANDVVQADCKNGEIYLNGIRTPELGALGNDWEDFFLTPGLNQIGVAHSSWVLNEYAPKFSVKYRETYL